MYRFLLLLPAAILFAATPPLRPEKPLPLPNVHGRIDHMSADVKGSRLFVSALGNNTVEVFDVKSGKHLQTITGLRAPQGVLYIPEANRLVVACRDDGTIRFYDGTTYQLIRTITKTGDADNLRWDPKSKTILAGYADGFIGFFDPTGKQLGEARLDGHPESFQISGDGTRVFVNVPTVQNIAVINVGSKTVQRTWPVTASGNFPMALDEANSRLFIVARKPAKLLTLDSASGVPIDDRYTVGDADDVFYDAARKRVYITGGDGNLDIVRQVNKNRYEPLATIPTSPGARTSLFVPQWNRLFVAAPSRDQRPAEILVFELSD